MTVPRPPLAGRRILVTGGVTAIGAAAVDVLCTAGARVAATFHHTMSAHRATATWLPCDVRDAASVDATVGDAVQALGDPARDLGPVLVFLAGPGAGFITGQLIPVDGGLAMVGG